MSPLNSPLLTLVNSTPKLRCALGSRRVLLLAGLTTFGVFTIGCVAVSQGFVSHAGRLGRRDVPLNSTLFDAVNVVTENIRRVAGEAAEQGLELLKWDGHGQDIFEDPELKVLQYDSIPRTDLINFDEPQEKFFDQLKPGVRYVTSLSYGGHSNQLISTINLLYLGKHTNRVVIIPTLIPLHFWALPANFSDFFDLPRFYHESRIPAVEFASLKSFSPMGTPLDETLSCWSIQEATKGYANAQLHSIGSHRLAMAHWTLPVLARGLGGQDIAFEAMRLFDFDTRTRALWIEKVKTELLPQQMPRDIAKSLQANLKPGFKPTESLPPSDQLLCFDNTLFFSPVMFVEPYTHQPPLEAYVPGEGQPWIEAGQHIHFTPQVDALADQYLLKIFGVSATHDIPPFISVHLRRGDFKEFVGTTALEKYQRAVARAVVSLQGRLDAPDSWRGPGKARFRSFGIPAAQYTVLTTTDEPAGSEFVEEVKALGWKVLDHSALGTNTELGPWYPTILDAVVLARGQGFVGTYASTFSYLAGLRVKYWRGGVVDFAV